ncbi:sodium-dependent neutral amino acid transporter B(0)AT3-like isoform X1 [Montipora foliosa]|uniref:sodium-dependent neutral amino acid transporter B(0)AT3-like isoform X1 n=1 Tax=Montipora foliosa TaxID=591990 RepID=UPI0035F10F09
MAKEEELEYSDTKKITFNVENEEIEEINNPHPTTDIESNGVTVRIYEQDMNRGKWGNQIEFVLAAIGFAVGLGNVWRFPYLCQKNGGGAFLIPYFLSLFLLGIPLFFLELAIGQSLRQGSVGVWNAIHPYLGGLGYACVVVCLLVGMYYNMIIAWCFYYLFASFQDPLPYSSCPMTSNGTLLEECKEAGRTQYYWYNKALNASSSIEESGGLVWHLVLVLLVAWAVVFLCMMRGVQSAGKAVYFTATFPYIVLTIFFGRGVSLEGAGAGVAYMFKPQFSKLANPQVWLEAATQIFFSLSVAFGGLIAMSSYNPVHNNCHRDAIMVSLINCGTSVFASIVIFSILGFKATHALADCQDMWGHKNDTNGTDLVALHCKDLEYWLSKSPSGPGLTFIAFTEAIVKMPASPIWSVLFFCMLLTLGLGSMFGTLEGVITPFYDLKIVPFRKEIMTAMICAFCYFLGLIFTQHSGQYWLQIFDNYCATLPLLFIGFCELVGVSYIYTTERFEDDIQYMLGFRPHLYWKICWRYVSPGLIVIIFIASIINLAINPMQYTAWDKVNSKTVDTNYPGWGYAVIVLLIALSVLCVPVVAFLRYFGILKYKKAASKPTDGIVAPGSVTPSLSHVPLPPMEVPLAGTRDDID